MLGWEEGWVDMRGWGWGVSRRGDRNRGLLVRHSCKEKKPTCTHHIYKGSQLYLRLKGISQAGTSLHQLNKHISRNNHISKCFSERKFFLYLVCLGYIQ